MKLVLIRHSKTIFDPKTPSLLWTLSEEGIKFAKDLSTKDFIKDIKVAYSSFQTKAVETALLIAKDNFIPLKFDNDLTEITSVTNGFITDYENTLNQFYDGKLKNINNGETLDESRARINKVIDKIVTTENADNSDKTVAVVSHCNILSIYSAQFTNISPKEIHNKMKMPDVAILDLQSKKFINSWGELL